MYEYFIHKMLVQLKKLIIDMMKIFYFLEKMICLKI